MRENQWQQEFDHYREYPEYQKINKGMSLEAFKTIFYFEWAHRVLGRTIGLVFALGFFWLWYKRYLTRRMTPHLVVMFVLGGLQGLLGWYMVKSGLVDNPDVSQYRLTAHLGTAILVWAFPWKWALLLSSALLVFCSRAYPCVPRALPEEPRDLFPAGFDATPG